MAASKCTKTAPWQGRRENVMFNKRRRSLFKKANELSVKTGTELYIVMHRGGRYFTYNSTDRQGWPPCQNDVETNYPLTECLDPSNFYAIRSLRRNERQQPKPQKTYHKVVREEGDPEQYQQSIPSPAGRAYVSPPSNLPMGDYSSPDLETTALLRAVENGGIGPNYGEGKHSADGGSEVTNELGRSSWDAGVENDFQLFGRHDTTTGLMQAGLGSVTEDAKEVSGLQDYMNKEQRKSCCDITSAPVPGRRKFIVPKLPDFSKLLERCT